MRLIVQKVSRASVEVDGTVVSSINNGVMCLCGICDNDTEKVLSIHSSLSTIFIRMQSSVQKNCSDSESLKMEVTFENLQFLSPVFLFFSY